MAINQLKIVISLLKEFSEGNLPTSEDYNISQQHFYDIIDAMQDETLIKGARFARDADNEVIAAFLENVKVTIRGFEYLNANSLLVKTYKGLKEVREWLPF